MSYDLYFWPSGVAVNPCRLAGQLADEDADGLEPDERVVAFRAELLRRWPDLADMIAPWHHDLGWRQPWGRTDLADRFVGVTLPYSWEHTAALPVLASAYGLDSYDPQSRKLMPSQARSISEAGPRNDRADAVVWVDGWVAQDNVVRLLEEISGYIGYPYDDLDEAALTGALDNTNDESADGWFEYPLEGMPALVVRLAQSQGSAVISVRVGGGMDLVLAARVETLLEVL
ncbi:hypothetical protein ACQEVC_10560 [Plantactinospora sp. CA-294935]|uniref:hypothetical protein n=1 Tax=Plantactinospora sp. CA-294935 TaxID=3240012 RepID=UPI003D8A6A7D